MHKILVVDDEQHIVDLIKNFLEEKHYQVITAFNGNEALQKMLQEEPHLVLLDLYMPGKNGMEVLREARQAYPGIGIVVVTGENDEDVGRLALARGAFDYIMKPVDFACLERIIWWYLHGVHDKDGRQGRSVH